MASPGDAPKIDQTASSASPSPACCASSSSGAGGLIGEAEKPLRPDELAYLLNESVRKRLFGSQDLAGVVPLGNLLNASRGALADDRLVGMLIPIHHLDILLRFCASELGLRFECPSRRVYDEATGGVSVSGVSSEENRNSARINNSCAVCHQIEIERQQEIVEDERAVVLSSTGGQCQIHHFRAVLLDQIRNEIAETSHRLLIDLGMEVDDQGRIVFKRRVHDSLSLHNVIGMARRGKAQN